MDRKYILRHFIVLDFFMLLQTINTKFLIVYLTTQQTAADKNG